MTGVGRYGRVVALGVRDGSSRGAAHDVRGVAEGDGFAQRVHARLWSGGNTAVRRSAMVRAGVRRRGVERWRGGGDRGCDASRGFALLGEGACVMRCVMVRVVMRSEMRIAARLTPMQCVQRMSRWCCSCTDVHHVAFDGASTGVLLGELVMRACTGGGRARGSAAGGGAAMRLAAAACSACSTSTMRCGSGARRSRRTLRRTASYWRSALREGDLPVLELPLDYPRPAVQTSTATWCM